MNDKEQTRTPSALDCSTMRMRIAELEAERSEAMKLLESLLPITWSEDWDADDVRLKLEWAIKFCGGKSPNSGARGSVLDGHVWSRLNARRGLLLDRLERKLLKGWEFEELKGLNILADARCEKHKAPNEKLTDSRRE